MHRMLIVEDDSGIAHEVAALAKCWDMDSRCADNFRFLTAITGAAR